MAKWFYVANRYRTPELLENTTVREAAYLVIRTLFERHASRLADDIRTELLEIWDNFEPGTGAWWTRNFLK